MTSNDSVSMEQLTAVLDNSPVAVYVSSLDDWELLYANRLAKEMFLNKPDAGRLTCYQAAGFDRPCPRCPAGKVTRDRLQVREYYHPIRNRFYQLSGKVIDWGGKPAHIEYVLDITHKNREEKRVEALQVEMQAAFQSMPCGLCAYRYDGKRIIPLFHNEAFYEIMGYSREHIQSVEQETDFLGLHPDDVGSLRANIQKAIRENGVVQQTFRIWNDREKEYRWIHLDGSGKIESPETKLLYAVFTDVSAQVRLEKELTAAYEKMQDIVNAIPGGVAIYKVTDIFQTIYYSDGLPELIGRTVEEYRVLAQRDATEMVYGEDVAMVMARAREVVRTRSVVRFEFRVVHRDGHTVWLRAQIKWIGEEDGCPLLHGVFHNISDFKEAQLQMAHLVNSIPGGIASYRVEGERFIPTFVSDGVMALSGHSREEYMEMVRHNALDFIYKPDRARTVAAALHALKSGGVMDISYRMRHKDGRLIWIHINGRRMGPLSEVPRFYAVFTGMSAEARLFRGIADKTADGIYVIDKASYDLLYVNESESLFTNGMNCVGHKCYEVLQKQDAPCKFCVLKNFPPDGEEHEMWIAETGRYFSTRIRETDWNGISAYVQYLREITEEVETRREKKRLEQYFQTLVKNLPGGVAVVRYEKDKGMTPEFFSNGFAALTGMTVDEAWELYRKDAMAGVHPDDRQRVHQAMEAFITGSESRFDMEYRLKKGDGGYVWVKNNLSLIQNEGGEIRIYAAYRDMTLEREERERLRQQYKDLILRHYRTPDPNALIVGHCNITQNRVLEIIDHTDSDLLKTYGAVQQEFFTSMSGMIVDEKERQLFLDTFLNRSALRAFHRGELERRQECFLRLPKEPRGRYVQIKMDLVATPDSGDVTGILTVTDETDRVVADRALHQLSVTGYDFIADVDLTRDRCTVLSHGEYKDCIPPQPSGFFKWTVQMLQSRVVPRDRAAYEKGIDPSDIAKRLQTTGPYTFSFSLADEKGDIRTKSMTVSATDLRLGRVCLAQTDITDSVREQQGLLNMIAYTFELASFINLGTGRLVMYTRQTVLENLSPYISDDYASSMEQLLKFYNPHQAQEQFSLEVIQKRLLKKPSGYDFVFSYQSDGATGYKQVNVLWGDENHKTICLVRADVTDVLAAERQTKEALEKALELAEEASRAKSDFLSAMSHDIRTPMNAVMGMTALAVAHLDDQNRVADCLQKISISSKHLMSLINDVLDMSKIERSQITLNRMKICLTELTGQLSAIMVPQARAAGLSLEIRTEGICHGCFWGDALRLNQIFINLLSNAIKFTPAGGSVDFLVEEPEPAKNPERTRYRFTVRDTGMGMSEEFRERLFEPFARSQSAAHIEGTGLGLSITKGLVDLMGGEISVESRLNQGTTFRIELECDCASEEAGGSEAAPPDPVTDKPLEGRRFLVAEDNAINAEILHELLAMFGAKAVVTENGRRAVEEFRNAAPGTYDAILMDIQMPELNGYEATRAIREMDRVEARDIPIVAMTANAFAEDVQASLDAGMTAHVAKPIDLDVLRLTLCEALSKSPKHVP